MSNLFNTIYVKKPRRNVFNLSHDRKFSTELGFLTPILCEEVIPSDKFTVRPVSLFRFAPLLAPVMHDVTCYIHYFFVPNRIVWDNWEPFITGGEDGSAEPEFPYLSSAVELGSLADYFGVGQSSHRRHQNPPVEKSVKVSALPFAAFNKIWNEYYRDQNLQVTEKPDSLIDGNNSGIGTFWHMFKRTQSREQYRRAWKHDYFTSALPFAQKGTPVTIPIGDNAPVTIQYDYQEAKIREYPSGDPATYLNQDPERLTGAGALTSVDGNLRGTEIAHSAVDNSNYNAATYPAYLDLSNAFQGSYADLSQATANTINDLRRAFRLQEWLEKNARGGTRYTEFLYTHFGVRSKDSRLQRPEYIGGERLKVQFSEVLQTSSPQVGDDVPDTPQANMAGHGITASMGKRISKYVEEHGYIIGILSITPNGAYQQGTRRQFFKNDRFDYYFQDFAHIGEQPIYNKELYYIGDDDSTDDEVFGYTPRYAEYRFIPPSVHGDFKETLDFWHMGRIFNNRPLLNGTFIECKPDKRIFAITDLPEGSPLRDWDTLYCHIFQDIKAIRPLPKFGIPSF